MGADYVTQSFTANPVNAPNTRPVPRIPAYDFMAIASGRLMRKPTMAPLTAGAAEKSR